MIQTASADAAVHVATGTMIRATIRFVRGSMRATPSFGSATQIDPNAATRPAGLDPNRILLTTRFVRGLIFSTVRSRKLVTHAAAKA